MRPRRARSDRPASSHAVARVSLRQPLEVLTLSWIHFSVRRVASLVALRDGGLRVESHGHRRAICIRSDDLVRYLPRHNGAWRFVRRHWII